MVNGVSHKSTLNFKKKVNPKNVRSKSISSKQHTISVRKIGLINLCYMISKKWLRCIDLLFSKHIKFFDILIDPWKKMIELLVFFLVVNCQLSNFIGILYLSTCFANDFRIQWKKKEIESKTCRTYLNMKSST